MLTIGTASGRVVDALGQCTSAKSSIVDFLYWRDPVLLFLPCSFSEVSVLIILPPRASAASCGPLESACAAIGLGELRSCSARSPFRSRCLPLHGSDETEGDWYR